MIRGIVKRFTPENTENRPLCYLLIRICIFKSSDGIATNVQLHAVEYFVDYRLSMDIKIVRQILTSANRNDMILPTTK